MADVAQKPPTVAELVWQRELVFAGRSGQASVMLDSAGVEGPSPMQALAFGFAGCMAMDVIYMLRKGRHDIRGCRVELSGERAQATPHRFLTFDLRFTVSGNIPPEALDRAIDLSREKYCSVWHSLRQDINLTVSSSIVMGLPGN
jgi:putative redox protein